MDIEKIKKSKTKILGKKIEYYKQINSTHLYAKGIANEDINNGKLILAEVQTAGIGTQGRKWYTGESNNIAMTLILKPKCKISKLDGLTIKIAECMKIAIFDLYGIDLKIKEPNDLLLNGKKICGILTQISSQEKQVKYLLISLGFNVNETKFSEETAEIATSLKKECHIDFSREDIIIKFLEILESKIELL